MARALWWSLTFATLATGARYADYADVKMPDYGSAIDYDRPRDLPDVPAVVDTDDYHEHTSEASTSLEYKYEEDRGKADKRTKEVGGTDEWQSLVKKHKKYFDNENQENFDTYTVDESSSDFKPNYRPSKNRPRLRAKNNPNEDLAAPRNKHLGRYSRNRKKDMGDIETKENLDVTLDDIDDNKGSDFEEDQIKVRNNYRETTIRTARRKPRDRFIKSGPVHDEDDSMMNLRKPIEDEFTKGAFRREDDPRIASGAKRQSFRQSGDSRMRADIGTNRNRLAAKGYDEYDDFYDMKRVLDTKEKLLREQLREARRTTKMHEPTRSWRRGGADRLEGLRRALNPTRSTHDYDYQDNDLGTESVRRAIHIEKPTNAYDYRQMNQDNDLETESDRRAMNPAKPTITYDYRQMNQDKDLVTVSVPPPKFTSDKSILRMMKPILPAQELIPVITISVTKSTTSTSSLMTTATPASTTTKTITTTEEEEEENIISMNNTTTEMSLAEKSRLSILKKAMKKDMIKGAATKKPPVLLQVTHQLHTLVMVEQATTLRPWQRVTVVKDDTLENVYRVKKLMRKKLVDNAKDLHELSENWDDVICDYIDMSLINEKSVASVVTLPVRLLLSFPFIVIAFN